MTQPNRKQMGARELRRANARARQRLESAQASVERTRPVNDQFAQLREVVLTEGAQSTFDEGNLLQAIAQHREQLAQSKVQVWLVAAQNAEPELLQVGLDKIKETYDRIDMLIELLGELKETGSMSLPDEPSKLIAPKGKLIVAPGDMAPVVPQ